MGDLTVTIKPCYSLSHCLSMCVAFILILSNFYKFYDAILEYCEHITAACLIMITVGIIMVPVMFVISADDAHDPDQKQPFIAIIVLISGVLGGLAMVITFIFFCKYCFKKKQHLTNNETVKKHISDRKGYEPLDGGNSVQSPVPVDSHPVYPQPKNYDVERNDLGNAKNELITLDDDKVIVHKSFDELEKGDISKQSSNDNIFAKCRSIDVDVPTGKTSSGLETSDIPGDPVCNSGKSQKFQLQSKHLLSIPTMAQTRERSRSVPKRELPSFPPSKVSPDSNRGGIHANSQYYARQYDRKNSFQAHTNWEDEPPVVSSRRRASVQVAPRSPHGRLPLSHQVVIDKTSPIRFHRYKSMSAADNNNDSKIYDREQQYSRANTVHGEMITYPSVAASTVSIRTQQHQMVDSRGYGQPHRYTNFSFEPFENRTTRKQLTRQGQIQGSPEAKPFEQFYEDFNKLSVNPVRQVSLTSSSGSSGREIPPAYLVTNQPSGAIPPRLIRSFDVYDYSQRGKLSNATDSRQIQSLDSAVSHPYPIGNSPRLQPLLNRQDTEDDAEREIDHVDPEEVKKQCQNLWSLRSTLELEIDDNQDDINDPSESQMTVICRYPEIEEQYATTSCTTSFESNTENVPVEERKISATYLEPPALTHEARKQKYRNLFARRQIQLQQQKGVSFETSFESFETVDSTGTDSSRPEMILNSFESNISYNSNVSNVSQTGEQTDSTVDSAGRKSLAELKNDSGYKSQSTEYQTASHSHAYDKVTQFPSTGSATLTDWDRGVPPTSLLQQNRLKQLSFETQYDRDSDSLRSEIPSGESFDDGSGVPQPTVAGRSAYFPPIRPQPQRDFSVDSKSDLLFREFSRYEPKFDLGKTTRYRHSLDSDGPIGNSFRPRLSPEDSIEEETVNGHPNNCRPPDRYFRPNPFEFRKHQVIPVIKLQTDADLCVGGDQ